MRNCLKNSFTSTIEYDQCDFHCSFELGTIWSLFLRTVIQSMHGTASVTIDSVFWLVGQKWASNCNHRAIVLWSFELRVVDTRCPDFTGKSSVIILMQSSCNAWYIFQWILANRPEKRQAIESEGNYTVIFRILCCGGNSRRFYEKVNSDHEGEYLLHAMSIGLCIITGWSAKDKQFQLMDNHFEIT